MSSVIDPVTGLPIVVPLNAGLDTIPLGVQTFPWKDYKATQRPNRGMAYPDDIIPVSSITTGMYQDAVQAVGTDGNHALLVKSVNPSGGGGSFPTVTPLSTVPGLGGFNTGTAWPIAAFTDQFLYGFSAFVSFRLTDLSDTNDNYCDLSLIGESSGERMHLWTVSPNWPGTLPAQSGDSITMTFPYKVDVFAAVNDTSWVPFLNNNISVDGSWSFHPWAMSS